MNRNPELFRVEARRHTEQRCRVSSLVGKVEIIHEPNPKNNQ